MSWHNDITGELPAPRDDEPENLRKDIADELSDHLNCALNRELHLTPDEQQAKQNVLAKFGNVQKIARQLWFDWMKEKIMSQRLTFAMMTLMAAVCVVLCVLIWKIADSNQATNLALLEQSRTMNQNIIDKLGELTKPAAEKPAKSLEWNPLKICLVKGETGGPPAEGFQARLEGNILNATQKTYVYQTSDADGVADFGLVRPGHHSLRITTPWRGNEYGTFSITLRPGVEHTEEIICPAEPLPQANVKISIDWPEDLKDKSLWAICSFSPEQREVNKNYWTQNPEPSRFPSSNRFVAISPRNEVVTFNEIQTNLNSNIFLDSRIETLLKQYKQEPVERRSRYVRDLQRMIGMGALTARGITGEFSPQLTWMGNRATMNTLGIGLLPAEKSTIEDIRLIYGNYYPEGTRRNYPPGFGGSRSTSFSKSPNVWPAEEREFILQPGRVNEWKITPPEWFLERVRLNLKVADAVSAHEQAQAEKKTE